MVSIGRANKTPPVRIPVPAGLDEIIDWKHPLLKNRKENTPEAKLLGAWQKDPGYRFFFDRKHIKKILKQIPDEEWLTYDQTLAYFTKGKNGKYKADKVNVAVPPRKGGKLNWECYTPKNQEFAPAVNRFMWFLGMGAAACRSGRVEDAETVFRVMDDWLDQNPAPEDLILGQRGVWPFWYKPWAPFNVACRCKYWLPVIHLLWNSKALTAERFGRYIQSFRQHVVYLGRVSTRLDKKAKGNHFLIEMEGMLSGSLFPWVKNHKENWDAAVHNLLRCVDQQILADGVHSECAPGYHRACMSWFNQPLLLARLNNTRIPKEILRRTQSMLDFGLHAVDPNGTGYRMADGGGQRDEFLGERFLARCSGRKLPVKVSQPRGFLPFLQNTVNGNGVHASKNGFKLVQHFPDGGFSAARSSWTPKATAFFMKLNTFGGGHSHADFLSFCYTHKGRTVIDERGTNGYDNTVKSIECKLTDAHNVVLLGDRKLFDAGDMTHFFDKDRGPIVKIQRTFFKEEKNGIVRTGGKVIFPDGTWWKREVRFDPKGGLRIRDEVNNKKLENVRIQFYLTSGNVIKNKDGSVTTADKGQPNIRISSTGDAKFKTSVKQTKIYGPTLFPAKLVTFEAKALKKGVWETVIEGRG